MAQIQGKLLTIKEVQDRLSVSDETVYRLIRANKLKAIRIRNLWRVREEDLQGFLVGAGTEVHTILKVVCMYCGAEIGEKDGQGVSGVSHGICRNCFEERFPDQEYKEG